MGKRKVEADPNHPLLLSIRWILENRIDPKTGKLFTQRGLSTAACLQPVHINQILKSYQKPNITMETAKGIARAANVRVSWLIGHQGEPGTYDEKEASAFEQENVELQAAIAFNRGRLPNEYLDMYATERAYEEQRFSREIYDAQIKAQYPAWLGGHEPIPRWLVSDGDSFRLATGCNTFDEFHVAPTAGSALYL